MRSCCRSVSVFFPILTVATFCFADADEPKLVIADYFAHHVSRLHDGQIGPWLLDKVAQESHAKKKHFVYNADLIDENGRHQLAALAHPLLGLQSDMDPDYQEFQLPYWRPYDALSRPTAQVESTFRRRRQVLVSHAVGMSRI